MTDTITKSGSDLLLEAARKLFFAHGYANVSMQAIAAEAGMTKGAPYYHFESKEDLFFQVSLGVFDELRVRLAATLDGEGTLEERLKQSLIMIITNMSGDFSSWLNDIKRVLQPDRQRCLVDTFGGQGNLASLVLPSFVRAAELGEMTGDSPEVASNVFFKLAMACIDEASYLQLAGLYSDEWCEQTARETARVLVHGIG